MLHLGIFGLEFEKSYCHIWNQHPQICVIAKFGVKSKSLNLGQKVPNLRNFGLEFEKIIIMLQISVLEFVLLQTFVSK